MGDERWPRAVEVELVHGPLDGDRLEYPAGTLPRRQEDWGAYMIVPGERSHPEDPGARAVYEPIPGGDVTRWVFEGWA